MELFYNLRPEINMDSRTSSVSSINVTGNSLLSPGQIREHSGTGRGLFLCSLGREGASSD